MGLLEENVRTDEKQRYSFNEDDTLIRANYGHPIPMDVELEEKVPPDILCHGTASIVYGVWHHYLKIDLHGLRQEEAIKVIDKAIAAAGPTTYHLQLIHGYNRGTSLRSMIYYWYQYDPKVKRIIPGDNPGITVLVLKELYS